MSALIDIIVTFIAAMVSAAFVHFGAHSEKPRPAAPPPAIEQTDASYEPARFETVSEVDVAPEAPEMAAPPAPPAPPAPVTPYQAHVEAMAAHEMAQQQAQAQRQAQQAQVRTQVKVKVRPQVHIDAH